MSPKLFDDLLKENTCLWNSSYESGRNASIGIREKVGAQCGQLVYTKWHDKKYVSFLSTNVSPGEPSRLIPQWVKGQEIKHMGGVGQANQLRYHMGWQSRKWYHYIFWFLFNLSVCNAHVLESFYNGNQNKEKRPLIDFKKTNRKMSEWLAGFAVWPPEFDPFF